MISKDIIRTMANKEMDRKEFLKYSGLVLLSLIGLKTVVTLLMNNQKTAVIESDKKGRGFGNGRYGA